MQNKKSTPAEGGRGAIYIDIPNKGRGISRLLNSVLLYQMEQL